LSKIGYHALDGKPFLDEGAPLLPEAMAKARIFVQLDEAFRQEIELSGANEEAGYTVKTHFASTVAIESNGRFPGRRCLGQSTRQPFPA
jgi:hypothetical protein